MDKKDKDYIQDLVDKIKESIECELSAYSEYEDDIGDVDSFDDGILEGRKEFAEEIQNTLKEWQGE